MKSLEKHFFAGGNTKHGFFSYFSDIMNPERSQCTYILKGGSGVGKSSMMKSFANGMKEHGYAIEYIHCASDENSLDAVYIPELQIAMLDGTAPHVVDPLYPGASEQIINLGMFLDNKVLMEQKSNIISIGKEKSRLYKTTYAYMKGAAHLLNVNNMLYEQYTDLYKLTCLAEELSAELFHQKLARLGSTRCLFAGAFTSNKFIDYSHTLCENYNIWEITSDSMCAISKLLSLISENGIKCGYHMECYYFPTEPDKIQHLIIPKLGVAIMSKLNLTNVTKKINLNDFLDTVEIEKYHNMLITNQALYNQIMDLAAQTLEKTKKQHDLLEHIYVNAMDFSKVNLLLADIMKQYSGEAGKDEWN